MLLRSEIYVFFAHNARIDRSFNLAIISTVLYVRSLCNKHDDPSKRNEYAAGNIHSEFIDFGILSNDILVCSNLRSAWWTIQLNK